MAMPHDLLRTKPLGRLLADTDKEGRRLRKALTAWDLSAIGIGCIIGVGIFVLPGVQAAKNAGPGIILSFAISAVACACSAENVAAVGDAAKWIKEQDVCIVTLWNGVPLGVTPPNFVVLSIVETDPGVRGDTSGGGGKPATLETGAVVRVPLFVQTGELIKVDTRTGEYVSRVKE